MACTTLASGTRQPSELEPSHDVLLILWVREDLRWSSSSFTPKRKKPFLWGLRVRQWRHVQP